ncbi:MAG: hypothetical protein AAF570_23555, partial [Bacteroidota bacterium]
LSLVPRRHDHLNLRAPAGIVPGPKDNHKLYTHYSEAAKTEIRGMLHPDTVNLSITTLVLKNGDTIRSGAETPTRVGIRGYVKHESKNHRSTTFHKEILIVDSIYKLTWDLEEELKTAQKYTPELKRKTGLHNVHCFIDGQFEFPLTVNLGGTSYPMPFTQDNGFGTVTSIYFQPGYDHEPGKMKPLPRHSYVKSDIVFYDYKGQEVVPEARVRLYGNYNYTTKKFELEEIVKL